MENLPDYNENNFMDGQTLECDVCGGNTFSVVLTGSTAAMSCPNDSWRGLVFSVPSMMPEELAPRKIMEETYKIPASLQLVTSNE